MMWDAERMGEWEVESNCGSKLRGWDDMMLRGWDGGS